MSLWVGSAPWVGSMPWVHPTTAAGWIGSGFDCGCDCTFEGGFHYEGATPANWGYDPPPICLLMFGVGNLKSGCTVIDIEDANITIVLKRNGTTITEPLIYDSTSNLIYWQRWKPIAGDVYTADVTLDCGYGNTFTRSFEYTIPTPANTACTCCDERDIDYVIVGGFTAEFAVLNGTFAATPTTPTCCWGFEQIPLEPLPPVPCGNLTFGTPPVINIPASCLFTVPPPYGYSLSGTGYYYYRGGGGITGLNTASVCIGDDGDAGQSDKTRLVVNYLYNHARRRLIDATPSNPEGCIERGGGGSIGYSVTFEFDCQTGYAIIISNTFPGQSPTLSVVFA